MSQMGKVIFKIGTEFGDTKGFLDLFGKILERANAEKARNKRFEVPFALLFALSRQNIPLNDLRVFCQERTRRPPLLRLEQNLEQRIDTQKGMFWTLLESCLEQGPEFGIKEGAEIYRVLAAVGQTLNARSVLLRQWNVQLAARHMVASRTPVVQDDQESSSPPALLLDPVHVEREDESGQCLSARNLVIWHASFIGPRWAGKTENQDATCVRLLGGDAVFALADGVSTSLGARTAAAAITRRFCDLHRPGWPLNGSSNQAKIEPLLHWLDDYLNHLLANTDSKEFLDLCGKDFQRSSVLRLLENTKTGKIANMPAALCATLIAGDVHRNGVTGQFHINLLRVGDGLVERLDRNGVIESILEMDAEVLSVPAALSPGPRARAALSAAGAIATSQVTLQEGEFLLISSDGLARGHHEFVTAKLNELLKRDVVRSLDRGDEAALLNILRDACEKADEFRAMDERIRLFADNVSLIVIASVPG